MEKHKIIFLDIDGPITYDTWVLGRQTIGDFNIPYPWVVEECIALTEIIKRTDAKVVISSDWRRSYTVDQMHQIFNHYRIPQVIIDMTHVTFSTTHYNLEMERAGQIARWVKAHIDEIDTWVALDDLRLDTWFDKYTNSAPYISGKNFFWCEGEWSEPDVKAKLRENVDRIVNFLNKVEHVDY